MAKTPAVRDYKTGVVSYDFTCSICGRMRRFEVVGPDRAPLNAAAAAAGWHRGNRKRDACCPRRSCREIAAIEQALKRPSR